MGLENFAFSIWKAPFEKETGRQGFDPLTLNEFLPYFNLLSLVLDVSLPSIHCSFIILDVYKLTSYTFLGEPMGDI